MPVTQPQRRVPWTTAGFIVGVLAVVFAAAGLGLALWQATVLHIQIFDEAKGQARLLRSGIFNAMYRKTTDALHEALVEPGSEAAKLAVVAFPALGTVYSFDGKRLTVAIPSERATPDDPRVLELLQERAIARWNFPAGDPSSSRNIFDHAELDGRPVVLAIMSVTETNRSRRLAAAAIDVGPLREQLIDPYLHDLRSIELTPAGRPSPDWRLSLEPVLPFWALGPKAAFVERLQSVFQRQVAVQALITMLPLAGLLGVIWALTRVARREMAVAQLKSSFVADVSHELKTPLALIRMFGETLLSGRVTDAEKTREYYGIITRESTRLANLIDNLLDFSRIDAGRKAYRIQSVDVALVVRETYNAYRHELDRQQFEHSLGIADNLPAIDADADAVGQALLNLMNNAVKYSDQDRYLAVEVARETRRGRHGVLISVHDRGIGIRPEDRARLFEGFFRAADERVRKRRGAGLGLALVKHIVDAHNGSIDVESRLVKGSTFRIFLPATDVGEGTEKLRN